MFKPFMMSRHAVRRWAVPASPRRVGFASLPNLTPFKKVTSCNRGEISIRFMRAATEMGLETIAVYSKEDIHSQHRYKADSAYLIGKGRSAVGAYLDIEDILRVAVESGCDAIHPGYGFLSENRAFRNSLRR